MRNEFLLSISLFILFGCATVSQHEKNEKCLSNNIIENISANGESKAEVIETFRDNARKSCYESCKYRKCNIDGKDATCSSAEPMSECCYMEDWKSDNIQPVRDSRGGWQFSSEVSCNCRCGKGGSDNPKAVYAEPFHSDIKKDKEEAADDASQKAKNWCSENECSRFKCLQEKKCLATKVSPARQYVKTTSEDSEEFISTFVLESCECRCQ